MELQSGMLPLALLLLALGFFAAPQVLIHLCRRPPPPVVCSVCHSGAALMLPAPASLAAPQHAMVVVFGMFFLSEAWARFGPG